MKFKAGDLIFVSGSPINYLIISQDLRNYYLLPISALFLSKNKIMYIHKEFSQGMRLGKINEI